MFSIVRLFMRQFAVRNQQPALLFVFFSNYGLPLPFWWSRLRWEMHMWQWILFKLLIEFRSSNVGCLKRFVIPPGKERESVLLTTIPIFGPTCPFYKEPALILSDNGAPCQNSDAPHKNTTDNCCTGNAPKNT